MGSSFLFLFFSSTLLPYLCISGPITVQTIKQPFTASHFLFIDQSGVFLISSNRNFTASISNSEENPPYYFFITHVKSNAIIWIANRNHPISDSDKLYLTTNGLAINSTYNSSTTSVVWSTEGLSPGSQVSAMELRDSGNLVLLDRNNVSLWESFDHPTDTIVMGQSLAVGTSVDCYNAENDRSVGDYRLVVTGGDAVLQWNGMSYWKLSMEPKGSQDSKVPVSFLALNDTGLFLLGSDRSTVVIKLTLGPADFRVAKLGFDGKFSVRKFVDENWVQEFVSPADECQIPLSCNKMGLCSSGRCSCPPNFHGDPLSKSGCTPTDASLALPSGCSNGKELNSSVFYVNLGSELDYFANGFMAPAKRDINLLACQDLCTRNCSCLGIFYGNSSGSCYLLENPLGSIMEASSSNSKRLGYVKTIVVSSRFICWRRNRPYRTAKLKLGRGDSSSSELEIISIPGLPVRFNYEDLVAATETQPQSRSIENDSSEGNGTSSSSSDSRLERRVPNEEVEKLVKVALCCLHEDPMLRPTMVNVVSMLEGVIPLAEPRQESLNFLRFYGRRFSEASRIEGSNERNEFGLFPRANLTSGTSSSYTSMSYMSAQQLSGPR
ncbi:hypothetical protein H0E87_030151 [Populus deltoides]|uniref:Uncharacterized protein n=1 Tax=Populus deltoides TaxID=3696 RepID=A0A8T2WDU5_POPDE|nr:hypothetical protein H0E87_030151 [Populus deltoides]